MSNADSIKSKIKKLLALSQDNPSDKESFSAFQKAQELMARYKLEQKDILDEDQIKQCVQVKTTVRYGSRSSDHYIAELAEIIADNFCCVSYNARNRGTQTNYVCFMGLQDDVDIAEEALHVANRTILAGIDRVYVDMSKRYNLTYIPAKYFNPLKLGYVQGYLDGLKQALDSQKERNQEWGLVLVPPQEAQDFISSISHREFNSRYGIDNSYYGEGLKDGKNFNMNKKIEGTRRKDMITD